MARKLPNGWRRVALRDCIESIESGVSVNGEDRRAVASEAGVLKVSAVSDGRFDPGKNKKIIANELARARLNPRAGSLIMSRANTPELVGSIAYVEEDHQTLFLSDKLWQIRLREHGPIVTKWLNAVLSSPTYREQLSELATGSSKSMQNISKTSFVALEVPAPVLAEQRRIVRVLDAADRLVEATSALLEQRLVHHEQVVRQLYDLSDQKGKKAAIGTLLSESRIQGRWGDSARKLSVKLYGKGVVAKVEKLRGSDKTRYYIRSSGQLIYSKLDFLNGAIGIVPERLDGYESTPDLPAFDIDRSANPKWLLGYLTRPNYYQARVDIARGQRIARRVNPGDLLATEIRVPPRELQDRIADALQASDDIVELLTRLCDLLLHQKRGLMQKLLTGQWRLARDLPDIEAADV
jgi:type I restriction enzyme, S subunit